MSTSTSDPGPKSPANLLRTLRARAGEHGFAAMRITRPDAIPQAAERLTAFLEAGHHGELDWLADRQDWRGNPQALWPQARSVALFAMNYGPGHDPMDNLAATSAGNISVYARGDDYHDVIKGRLKQIANWFASVSGEDVKVFVDTAPVMEKPLAQAAGIGWQGKHTNLLSRELGSWFFLGAMFTTAELPEDAAEEDHCGTCRACLDICPTNAFPAPYRLDARRCISYLTIEHKGHIPAEFRPAMGNRIYGCDDCLAVCPWNKFAEKARETRLAARKNLTLPPLSKLAKLDDPAFREMFRKSPVKRTGRDRFVRNVLIAIGNSGDAALADEAERLLDDASPLVRAMAVWALAQLGARDKIAANARRRLSREKDADVLNEWRAARTRLEAQA
ncbi:tRNA epoxyqueuosine(34) reductase QueG [Tepidamorphus sp. 3E244]|uniref:tRNA epoxyqueuosine(34) reductase QueG n=1 Tax=Tepidamorphus sp. 3E244 TaxID=3385498 RepID=UPI0038FC7A2B